MLPIFLSKSVKCPNVPVFFPCVNIIEEYIPLMNDNLDDYEEVHSYASKENPQILSLILLILFSLILWETIR